MAVVKCTYHTRQKVHRRALQTQSISENNTKSRKEFTYCEFLLFFIALCFEQTEPLVVPRTTSGHAPTGSVCPICAIFRPAPFYIINRVAEIAVHHQPRGRNGGKHHQGQILASQVFLACRPWALPTVPDCAPTSLKICHRHIFFTLVALSGFESHLTVKQKEIYQKVYLFLWYTIRDSNPGHPD